MIDCSNRVQSKAEEISQAEYLQTLVPRGVTVVKAFNVLSAYALENGGGMSEPKEVIYYFIATFRLLSNMTNNEYKQPIRNLKLNGQI